jgi:hypothetical protein
MVSTLPKANWSMKWGAASHHNSTLLVAEGSSVISRQQQKAILEHTRRNVEQLVAIVPLIPREDLCPSSAIFGNHSRGTSQPRENSQINGIRIRGIDTSNTVLKMNRPHLFQNSDRRCSKCINIIRQVEKDESPYWTEYRDGAHVKKHGYEVCTDHFQPNHPCRTCSSHLQARQYEKLGDHLVEAHDITRDRSSVSEKGCCYLCLLCLQLKCRNGFKSNGTQLVMENGLKQAFIHANRSNARIDLQLFSESIDGLVAIARYLPEG